MAPKKKKITIYDVALKADISYQTVSRVLNGNGKVAEETRKRILQAMEELDFVPNKVARTLITNRSHTLELIVVDVTRGEQFADSIRNMALVAKHAGYELLVTLADEENLEVALENAAARLIDGAVMIAPSLHISDEKLLELCDGMPLVRRDYVTDSQLAWVGFDQVRATRMAVGHLIELGHRQIAAIPPSLSLLNGQLRYSAWKETLEKHGLEPGPVCEASYTSSSGYAAMKHILSTHTSFTAVMMGSDAIAQGAIWALREHGLRIPDDVSVISFDNAEQAPFTDPPLTTINFDFKQQDIMATRYLIEILNDPEMKLHQRILPADLMVRASTRKLTSSLVEREEEMLIE